MAQRNNKVQRWKRDPEAFPHRSLSHPQTGQRFELFAAERIFLKHAFRPTRDGDLPYATILWSCIKKSGKSTFGALCLLYVHTALGGKFAESYILANDLSQAQERIFTTASRIVEASALLEASVTADKIEFPNGSFIKAIQADWRGAAGVEPTMICVDELWGFTTEAALRLYEECTTTPTRRPSVRMVTSYAGFTGESKLLEDLVSRGLKGEQVAKDLYVQPGMIAFVSHDRIAPWQTEAWLEESRRSTRPSAFMRQYENKFTSGESEFIDMDWFDACVDPDASPLLADPRLAVWCGIDASVKRDSTAVAVVCFDQVIKKPRLVWHRIWQPSISEPLDFEGTIEKTMLELRRRFWLKEVRYDPYQMAASAQRLTTSGVPMLEFAQTTSNLTAASSNLYELFKGKNLTLYPDPDVRLAVQPRCGDRECKRLAYRERKGLA